MTEITTLALPKVINDAMAMVGDPEVPFEDRVAFYALLTEFKRRIDKSLGTYVRKGPSAKSELTEHLVRNGEELGPLYIAWEAFDVSYPINSIDNWLDAQVQGDLQVIYDDPTTREFVRLVPSHLEVDVTALGKAVHDGSLSARQVWEWLKAKRYRIDGGKRAALKVREVVRAA